MTTNTQPKNTPPRIERIDARMATLQRRLDHLERRLTDHNYASAASAEFDRAEIAALTAALVALNFVKESRGARL